MMKNETTMTAETLPAGVTLEDGVMYVDTDEMLKAEAIACVNAIKATMEGQPELAEEFAPGFAEWFFAHDEAGRKGVIDEMLAVLNA